jgi:hypothetical protein
MQWKQDDGLNLPLSTLHQRLTRVQVSLVTFLNMEVALERALYNLAVDLSNNTSKGSTPNSGRGYQMPTPVNPK